MNEVNSTSGDLLSRTVRQTDKCKISIMIVVNHFYWPDLLNIHSYHMVYEFPIVSHVIQVDGDNIESLPS